MNCYYCGCECKDYCIEPVINLSKDIVFCSSECYTEYSGCDKEDNKGEDKDAH